MENRMKEPCPYQFLLDGQWITLHEGRELPGGRLAYTRRTGAKGILNPGEWRFKPRPKPESAMAYTPAKISWYKRLWAWLANS